MKTIYPEPVSQDNFLPYGQCIDLFSSDPAFLDRPLKLGLTFSDGGDFICSKMERHKSTEEYLFSGEAEMILAVSGDAPDSSPHTGNIKVFSVNPGTLIKLNPSIWHAECHHPSSDSYYYFMAHNNGSPDETKWFPLYPEAVKISCLSEMSCLPEVSCLKVSCLPEKDGIFKKSIWKEQVYPQPLPGIPSNKRYRVFSEDLQLLAEHIIYQDENICTGDNWRCWMTEEDCLSGPSFLQMHRSAYPASTETLLLPDIPRVIFCGNSNLTITVSSSLTKPCLQEKITLKPGELLKLSTAVKQAAITPALETCDLQANNNPEDMIWFYTLSAEPLKPENNCEKPYGEE